MTNEEAIERLKWVRKRICDITYSPESFEALNLAIKALEERPKGEWLLNSIALDERMCSVCHEKFDNIPTCMGEPLYNYCPICGARLER